MTKQIDDIEISFLDFPENVRRRTGMYLNGPNHCVQEIVDNAVDEFLAGYCTQIDVSYSTEKKQIIVKDNGRGIPVAPSKDPKHKGVSMLQSAICSLHAGGKYGNARENSYTTITSGLNGVGSSAVNAVSTIFQVDVYRDGYHYQIICEKGIVTTPVTKLETVSKNRTGTTVTFVLDPEIWREEEIQLNELKQRLQELAYLNPGLIVTYTEDNTETISYQYPEGIQTYIQNLTANTTHICEPILLQNHKNPDMGMDIAFLYTSGYTQNLRSYVNTVPTERAGDHVAGFKLGIVRTINTYISQNNIKGMSDITQDDMLEGITAIIAVQVKEPRFEGQAKTAIRMPELKTAVAERVQDVLFEFLSKNQKTASTILDKISNAAKARLAAKRARQAARDQTKKLSTITLPGKLKACSSKDPEKCELFLVEGDSAAGTSSQARDSKTQAILPVFGKILNAEKRGVEALNSSKILEAIKALGCGIGDSFNIDKLRYHKIIIMADADSDGGHIATLWITFFYRYFPEIIRRGYLYIAISPLYALKDKKGNVKQYIYTQSEMDETDATGYDVQRYKGLGELNADQLWETTLDPARRKLIQVTAQDAEANENCLRVCMSKDVNSRREFLMTYANM